MMINKPSMCGICGTIEWYLVDGKCKKCTYALKELDKAKQRVDKAFDKYDRIGDNATAEDFYLEQKQYLSMFKKYWSQISD